MLKIEPMDQVLAQNAQVKVLQDEFMQKHALSIRKRLLVAALNKGAVSQD